MQISGITSSLQPLAGSLSHIQQSARTFTSPAGADNEDAVRAPVELGVNRAAQGPAPLSPGLGHNVDMFA